MIALAEDKNWNVRRQVAASIGEMPAADRLAPALALLTRDGADPIVVDAAISSLKGMEARCPDEGRCRVETRARARRQRGATPGEAVAMLAAAVAKSGDAAGVQRAIDVVADASQPEWQRVALLQGLDAGLPAPGAAAAGGRGRGGRGGGGGGLPGLSAPGGRVQVTAGRGVSLPGEPAALTKLASGTDAIALLAKNVAAKLDWPGRPAPVVTAPPLTAEQQKRFDAGAEIYKNICMGCHQEDGRGKDKLGANLVDSPFVNAADPSASIRILIGGKEGTDRPDAAARTRHSATSRLPPRSPTSAARGDTRPRRGSAERHGSAGPVEGPHEAVDRSRSCRPPDAAARRRAVIGSV